MATCSHGNLWLVAYFVTQLPLKLRTFRENDLHTHTTQWVWSTKYQLYYTAYRLHEKPVSR